MSVMISEVYEAFREAGVADEKARAAATAIADFRDDISDLKSDNKAIKAELAMIKWIVSGIGFGVLLLVIKSFWPM